MLKHTCGKHIATYLCFAPAAARAGADLHGRLGRQGFGRPAEPPPLQIVDQGCARRIAADNVAAASTGSGPCDGKTTRAENSARRCSSALPPQGLTMVGLQACGFFAGSTGCLRVSTAGGPSMAHDYSFIEGGGQ
jgi:hypothetical protein